MNDKTQPSHPHPEGQSKTQAVDNADSKVSTTTKLEMAEKPAPASPRDNSVQGFAIDVGKEGLKSTITGSIVAASLLVGDAILHDAHTKDRSANVGGTGAVVRGSVVGSTAKFLSALVPVYANSAQASIKKNMVIGQRDNVNEIVTGKSKKQDEQAPYKPTLGQTVTVAATLGIVDTTLTQNNSNKRVWAFQKMKDSQYQAPNPASMVLHAKAFSVGYPLRATRNVANIAGFIVQPQLKAMIQKVLPEGKTEELSHLLAANVTGVATGAIGNAVDIVYKNQVLQTNAATLKAPNAYDVVHNLVVKNGPGVLKRGLGISIAYSTAAQYIVPKAEEVAAQAVTKLATVTKDMHSRFFKPVVSTPTVEKDSVQKTNEQEQQSSVKNGPSK